MNASPTSLWLVYLCFALLGTLVVNSHEKTTARLEAIAASLAVIEARSKP